MASSWRGAVELGGFPINVKLSNRVKVTRAPSFRNLDPETERPYPSAEPRPIAKGVALGGDEFLVLTEEALEKIKGVGKDTMVKPRQLVPLKSIDLALSLRSFRVAPDDKVPASEGPVNLLWNGLLATGLAYVTQIAMAGGSMDSILVLYATDEDHPSGKGLWASAYPFANELFALSEVELEEDKKAQKVFDQYVKANYETELGEAFDHVQYASGFLQRREEAIEAVKEGKEIVLPKAAPEPQGPSLMDVLEAGVKEASAQKKGGAKKKAPAKKTTRKKVAA